MANVYEAKSIDTETEEKGEVETETEVVETEDKVETETEVVENEAETEAEAEVDTETATEQYRLPEGHFRKDVVIEILKDLDAETLKDALLQALSK